MAPGKLSKEEEHDEPSIDNMENIENQPKKKEEQRVIKMDDFAAVNMEEKLNLLMVAINKINTNFHNKFKDMYKKIFDDVNAVEPRIVACESNIAGLKEKFEDKIDDKSTELLWDCRMLNS